MLVTIPGVHRPLEGTNTSMPMPPIAIVWSHNGRTIAFNQSVPAEHSDQTCDHRFIVRVDQDDLP